MTLGRRTFLRSVSAAGACAALDGFGGVPQGGAFAYDGTLRDGCWLYGHDSGDHDGLGTSPMNFYNVPMSPALSVAEAARGFGLHNVCVCRWGRTDDAYLRQYRDLKRVSWAITGARNTRYPILLEHNFALLDKMPNLVAFDLDDYFRKPVAGTDEVLETPRGKTVSARAALPYFELQRLHRRMQARTDRTLALQLVVYDYMLREEMRPVFDSVDVVQYWTWCGKDIRDLATRFRHYRRLAPGKPTVLGIYMWDYGNRRPLEPAFMKQQLEVGFDLWKRGEVEGFVFHCSNLLNKNLPPAEYARDWFAEHADATRERAAFHAVKERPETVAGAGFVNVPDLSVRGDRMREIRAELDAKGLAGTELRVGGDEWLPFAGQADRQLLACGKGRVLILEPSGRVVWQHATRGPVVCARIDDRTVCYSDGALHRVPVALPCDPKAPVETVYRGPTEANDVKGFDLTPDGSLVAAAGEHIVELDGETFVPRVWIRAGKGVRSVRKTRAGTYLAVFDAAVREFDDLGRVVSRIQAEGRRIGDALRLADGSTLVTCGDEIRSYAKDGAMSTLVRTSDLPDLKGAELGSLQRLEDGGLVVGVIWGDVRPKAAPVVALGLSDARQVVWSVRSAADGCLPCVLKIQCRERFD